jgi:hypothetical protein
MPHSAVIPSAFQAYGRIARVIRRLRVIPTFDRRHEILSQPLVTGQTLVLTLSICILLSGMVNISLPDFLLGRLLLTEDSIPIL